MALIEFFRVIFCMAFPFMVTGLITWYIHRKYGGPIEFTAGRRSESSHDFIDSAMFLSLHDD